MTKFDKRFIRKFFSSFGALILFLSFSVIPSLAADKVYFYHTDVTGTPMVMTDDVGVVVWEADYLPFGEEYSLSETKTNKHRFIGKEKDEETDLYYFGARYLDDRFGRFTQTDPIGISESDLMNPQRFNRYAYGLNNPYRVIDPDGNIPIDTIWDIGNIIFDIATRNWEALALDSVALAIPYVPAGMTKVAIKIDDAIDASKAAKKAAGRSGRQAKLKELANDPKVSSKDRGWIKQDMNEIKRGKRKNLRVPPGKNLAHRRGYKASEGHSYKHSDLQDTNTHKLQHKHEGY